jgi:hypothetical protein
MHLRAGAESGVHHFRATAADSPPPRHHMRAACTHPHARAHDADTGMPRTHADNTARRMKLAPRTPLHSTNRTLTRTSSKLPSILAHCVAAPGP